VKKRLLFGLAATVVLGIVGSAVVVEQLGLTPRALGPYIEHRTGGHNPAIVAFGHLASRTLLQLDRGDQAPLSAQAFTLGAQAQAAGSNGAASVLVASADELRIALTRAEPGSVITVLPGTYRFAGATLDASRPGASGAPIIVRALQPGTVHLEFALVEGFRISAPYWRFENLAIRGVCSDDDECEHAFHVVGAASHFAAVNNTISDFNAHFKINGEYGRFPDNGMIVSNTLDNAHPRATSKPVTPIDLVAASGWTIRANVISDFIKDGGDGISYGAFAKGAGSGNVFERNMVWCERKFQGRPGQRVGLSLGGGGTGKEVCRDGKCITEQEGGILRANLIVACSDVGIYLNSAARSRIEDNTVVDTGGIEIRFPASSAALDGNLVDGAIRSRNGGVFHLGDNRSTPLWQAFGGRHPVRALFADPAAGDFSWRNGAPLRGAAGAGAVSLCGTPRAPGAAYGAFDRFDDCLARVTR
jgi:hypothetical protein